MRNPFWLRLYCIFVFLQALLVAGALVMPAWTVSVMPWPAAELDARFISALYAFGAISALLGIFAAHYAAVRITIIEVAFLTLLLLLLTIPHFGEFTAGSFPYTWTILYLVFPLVSLFILWFMHGRDPVPRGLNRLLPILTINALALTAAGIVLLFMPSLAVSLWPWTLDPVLGQLYGIFILAIALGGYFAIFEPRWEGVWIYCAANFATWLLIIAVSFLHRESFHMGASSWVWAILCLLGFVGFGLALLQRPRADSEILMEPDLVQPE